MREVPLNTVAWTRVGRRSVKTFPPTSKSLREIKKILDSAPESELDLLAVKATIAACTDTELEGLHYSEVAWLVACILRSSWADSHPELKEQITNAANRHIHIQALFEAQINPVVQAANEHQKKNESLRIGPLSRLTATAISPEMWKQLKSAAAEGDSALQILRTVVANCTSANPEHLDGISEVFVAVAAALGKSQATDEQVRFISELIPAARKELLQMQLQKNPLAIQERSRFEKESGQLRLENENLRLKLQQSKPGHLGLILSHENRTLRRAVPEYQLVKPARFEERGDKQGGEWAMILVAFEAGERGASRAQLLARYPVSLGRDSEALKQTKKRVNDKIRPLGVRLADRKLKLIDIRKR